MVKVSSFALIYFLSAMLGLSFSPVAGIATPIWPPSGIALAALLIFGQNLWPGITLGAFLINYSATGSFAVAAGIAIGNTLETWIAVLLLNRLGFDRKLERYRDILLFLLIPVFACSAISATIGIFTGNTFGVLTTAELPTAFRTWWMGDALGDLVVAPFLLMIWKMADGPKQDLQSILEEATVYLVIVGLSLVFLIDAKEWSFVNYLRPNMLLPVLLWAAFRFSQRGATTVLLLLSLIFTWGTAINRGPFSGGEVVENFLGLQLFIGITTITFLFVGTLIFQWRQTQRALQRAVADRDDFLAIVSHDLKNPISTILLNAQLLKMTLEKNDTPKNLRRQVDVFMRAGNQMKNLVENLLDTTKAESGTFFLELRLVKAQSLVDESLDMFKNQAAEKSIQLLTQVENKNYEIYGDPYRILQVLSNLLGNAIKFTPSGGSICLYVICEDRQAHFIVEDSGTGIPADQLPHIFDRYWQGKRVEKSSIGLGLSIAKGIVDAHGGRIWAANRATGHGARIHFTLPLAESFELPADIPSNDITVH